MNRLVQLIALSITAVAFVGISNALTYDELRNLPALPEHIYQMPRAERLQWVQQELAKKPSDAEEYRLKRIQFFDHFYSGDEKTAISLCEHNQPLREDFYYRQLCIDAEYPKFQDFAPQMLELIHDARQAERLGAAADLLKDLAWRQSQFGDIAGAYESYELALSLAPADEHDLVTTIMMDTATNYIVHGDEIYIQKGIELLKRTREQAKQDLEKATDENEIYSLNDVIQLTNFNTGIAYTLHLYDYAKALDYFDRVNRIQDSGYLLASLSFSSLAAAELGQFERAQSYIEKVAGRSDNIPVIDTYLSCYRQLATRRWQPQHSVDSCLNLDPETTVEVQLDVYKRLSTSDDVQIKLHGLQKLKELFVTKLEPQLRGRGSQAASNTELKRLQRESELKSVVLEQQEQLQQERDEKHATRIKFFIASFAVLVFFILFVGSQFRQKKKLAEQFQQMSVRDSLTKLGNRRFLEQHIERELAFTNREIRNNKEAALGIYIFDIDHFKSINDTYGHQIGDEVLVEIAERIKRATRDTDLFVRWGGEEFVYIARIDNNQRTYQLAQRLLHAVNSEPFDITGHPPLKVTCTIGAVKYPFIDTSNIELWTRLISLADAALYYGKAKWRDCWVVVNNEGITDLSDVERLLKLPLEQALEESLVTVKTSQD